MQEDATPGPPTDLRSCAGTGRCPTIRVEPILQNHDSRRIQPMASPPTRENCADILCIGTQKAATTWIHQVLNAHPLTYAFPNSKPVTSNNKEAHFWNWNHARGVEWYRQLMTPPEPTRLSMDFTPEYSLMTEAQISECEQINPSARVIYVLRDPLARSVSALRMYVRWRSKNAAAGDATIRFDEEFLKLLQHARVLEMTSYVANYERWARHYDDILVLNYEDIQRDPLALMSRIYAHCGLDIETIPPDARGEFDRRMKRRVWVSTRYAIDRDALHFLHGLLWPERQAAEERFGFTFSEFREALGSR